MSEIRDTEELAICMDITSRLALFALAKSMSEDEIKTVFSEVDKSLNGAGVYSKGKVTPLIDSYKGAVIAISKAFD